MLSGSCLCGGVRYEYDGEVTEISRCHCRQCQKQTGSAFVAVCTIESAKFRIVTGASLLKEFRATPPKARVFCGNCGSPIYSALDHSPAVKRLRIGSLDTRIDCENQFHIHVSSKAQWDEIEDRWPKYEQAKPEKSN